MQIEKENKILDSEGFDSWASSYDQSVSQSEQENVYPFAAYTKVMEEIHRQVSTLPGKSILDMGVGTAHLTSKLYDEGYSITGLDFSWEMLALAKEKMPRARLMQVDFKEGLPKEILEDSYDAILFTYSIHHLTLDEQVDLLLELKPLLKQGGVILLGDVMTKTKAQMSAAREKDRDHWDDEEHYIVVEELLPRLPFLQSDFYPKSYCSGVLVLR